VKTRARVRRRAKVPAGAGRGYRAPARADPALRALLRAPPAAQRAAESPASAGGDVSASVAAATSSGGAPLPEAARERFEPRFGHDLSAVRVHAGAQAAASAHELNAHAYTFGHDVVFGAGQYDPGSAAGQRLLAHELAHVVQQGDGQTLRRVPRVAGVDWPFNHGDVKHGHAVDLLAVAFTTLGLDKAGARRLAQAAAGRAKWDAKKDLYVLAFDFLRDNVQRFGVPDTARLIERVLEFCDASTAVAAALNDAFYGSLLASTVYTGGSGDALLFASAGGMHNVPGVPSGATDFAPSGGSTLLRPNPEPPSTAAGTSPNARVTGGFAAGTDLLVAYGGQQGTVAAASVELMLDAHKKRVPAKLRPYLVTLGNDPNVLSVLQRFLRDDGVFVMQGVRMGGAHYTPSKPPSIEVDPDILPGSKKSREMSEPILRSTLAHELFHYALDRADAAITEIGGNADHQLIAVVQDRYIIVALLHAGQPPIADRIAALGAGVTSHLGDRLENMLKADDRAGVRSLVGGANFLEATVFNLLVGPVAGNADKASGKMGKLSEYMMDASQIGDMAYLAAINGLILRKAFQLAADTADREKVALGRVWGRADYQKEIRAFISSFIGLASQNRKDGAAALAATIK